MLDGLSNASGGDPVLPFVLQFFAQPSEYWTDDYGHNHLIHQGEGANRETR